MKTVEERLEFIEDQMGRYAALVSRDRAEHLAWKRDMENRVEATWVALERYTEQNQQASERHDREMAALRAQTGETDRRLRESGERLDARIDKLVTAIGELIQRLPAR